MKSITLRSCIMFGLFSLVGMSFAADQVQTQDQSKTQAKTQQQLQDREIYGHQLMSNEERNTFRQKMLSAKTAEEREQIRKEHHAMMQARAKQQGVALPDEPRTGRGMGTGDGKGAGKADGMGGGGGGKGRQ